MLYQLQTIEDNELMTNMTRLDLISASFLIFLLSCVVVRGGGVNNAVDGVSDLYEWIRPLLLLPLVVRPNFFFLVGIFLSHVAFVGAITIILSYSIAGLGPKSLVSLAIKSTQMVTLE